MKYFNRKQSTFVGPEAIIIHAARYRQAASKLGHEIPSA